MKLKLRENDCGDFFKFAHGSDYDPNHRFIVNLDMTPESDEESALIKTLWKNHFLGSISITSEGNINGGVMMLAHRPSPIER